MTMISMINQDSIILLPLSCGLIIIILGYMKLWKLRKTKNPEMIGIFGIWLMGIIGFLLGLLGQLITTMRTFDAIAMAGHISPSIVADGLKSSYKSTLIGLVVLIISLIIWGILKGIKQKKNIVNTVDKNIDY